ncbi:hypothetical protein [Cohnella cholangitidis]|uniref:Uncharacterized protein n=1 Tax=Cohnella cholangitidis TaxID=2598458 RepID=A0A7G5BZT8_9BACL|nr:hypothetical protein [Cohnella cholangitidis]QMV42472.1 hypothetical protein FPL14_15655 [Cohnella cholangitidis]
MSNSRVLKWITGSIEIFLAIPLIGALVVMGSGYTVLVITLILHIVTLVLSSSNKEPIYGSVMGIITSLLAWIPFVGWLLHLLTGIFLMVTAAKKPNQLPPPPAPHY